MMKRFFCATVSTLSLMGVAFGQTPPKLQSRVSIDSLSKALSTFANVQNGTLNNPQITGGNVTQADVSQSFIAPQTTGAQAVSLISANGQAINQEATRALAAEGKLMPQSLLNAPNGVAGLDANQRITSDINNTNITTVGATAGVYSGGKSLMGVEPPSPIISLAATQDIYGRTPQLPGDTQGLNFELDRTLQIGGQRTGSWGHIFTYGRPYAGGMDGVIDGVFMNGKSMAQGTGISAGTWTGMVGNGLPPSDPHYNGGNLNDDAAARATETGSTPPLFIASSAISDPDNNTHAVTFRADGADFSPALPAYWGKQIRPGMNIATNVVAAAHVQGNNWNEPWLSDAYFRKAFNTFFGTIASVNQDAFGNITGINIDTAWYLPQQTQAGFGTKTGLVPMRDTFDGSAAGTLDTQFTNINAPAVFFGVFTKAFPEYELCALTRQPGTDSANPSGTINSLVHECDDEHDLWNWDPRDYMNSIHGVTYTLNNGGGGKLTRDSYGVGVSGGGALPLGMRVWGLLSGSIAYQAMSNSSTQATNVYQPDAVTRAIGDEWTSQAWQFSSSGVSGGNTSTLRLVQFRDVDTTGSVTPDTSTTSVHLAYKYDYNQDPRNDTNTITGGQLVYDPAGYRYGVGIGAGGSYENPVYSLIAMPSGPAIMPQGATMPYVLADGIGSKSGKGITATDFFTASSGLAASYVKTNGIAPTDAKFLTVTAPLQIRGGSTSDQPYSLANLPNSPSQTSDGAHVWCGDCKTPKGHTGMPVYWRVSEGAWTDAMDNPLSN
ncbi:hypothetical protein [Neokomagataea anthophila]|uniref:TonB-dependent receptor n=1 Tax=Neokomagataea anthophila TaxID=2826925 RepID=A0ABS5E7Y3_9PROT|nr:hypothetical protein [Neokomagataea anthophila]MBR0560019.1 hypothetical protein [Neokomagataea anthophila]